MGSPVMAPTFPGVAVPCCANPLPVLDLHRPSLEAQNAAICAARACTQRGGRRWTKRGVDGPAQVKGEGPQMGEMCFFFLKQPWHPALLLEGSDFMVPPPSQHTQETSKPIYLLLNSEMVIHCSYIYIYIMDIMDISWFLLFFLKHQLS